MTNVVAFPVPAQSTFDEAWAMVPTTMRRRSCKLSTLRELWNAHGKSFGHSELRDSLKCYISDKDFSRHGGQALERWLKAGRYEHFSPTPEAPAAEQFPDPMIRRVVAQRLGEDFARLYLDPCQVEGSTLIVRTMYAADRMKEHRALFKELGFTGMRKGASEA